MPSSLLETFTSAGHHTYWFAPLLYFGEPRGFLMVPLIVGIILILLAVVLAFLFARARAAKSFLLRWPIAIIVGLLTVLVALVGAVDLRGIYTLNAAHPNPASDLKASASPDSLARGEHLTYICAGCHSTTGMLPLDGGQASMLSNPDGSGLGDLYAPNLTPGGPLKDWSDGEIIRAIREGVAQDGHPLMIMPSTRFRLMSDADVQAVVAYLRSEPAVSRTTPPRQLNLIGTLLVGAGVFPLQAQPAITGTVTAPPAGVTADYGQYLVTISVCQSCHGENLAGGTTGQGPAGPNLTLIVPRWTETQFVQTIRTGKDPTGYTLRPDMMPWKNFSAAYSDDEIKAMFASLRGLQPIQR
jgi:mono/diheme cytochrome c family protein